MDEIEKRLREVADNCLKAYQDWHTAKKSPEAREVLQDAIHEMRKASARLEIEIAVSERDEMGQRPIPIPPHRATRKGRDDDEGDNAGNHNDGNSGNQQGSQQAGGGQPQRHVLRRRSQHGGGGGGGQPKSED